MPIIRVVGPGTDGVSPLTIVFLAAVAFFPPAALLSAVSPLTVKAQLRDVEHTGRVVGRVEALGTAGSLVGVFGTGFILVAEFPTTPVVIALGGALVLAGIVLWLRRRTGGRGWPRRGRRRAGRDVERRRGRSPAARATSRRPTSAPAVDVDEPRPSGRTLRLDDLRHAYVDLDDPTYLEFPYTQLLGDVVDAMAPARRADRRGAPRRRRLHDPALRRGHPARLGQHRPGARPGRRAHRRGRARPRARPIGCASVPATPAETSATSPQTAPTSSSATRSVGAPCRTTSRPRSSPTDVRRVLRDDGIYAQNIIDQPPLDSCGPTSPRCARCSRTSR